MGGHGYGAVQGRLSSSLFTVPRFAIVKSRHGFKRGEVGEDAVIPVFLAQYGYFGFDGQQWCSPDFLQ